jgi:predicted nucleic acid-binding protein
LEKIVLDTNILIEILKGNSEIIKKLEESDFIFYISSITVMELYYGAFNKKELLELEKFVNLFNILELNTEISKIATKLIFTYAKSHNLSIPDSLIASSAIENDFKLLTLNLKDFKFIDGLNLVI